MTAEIRPISISNNGFITAGLYSVFSIQIVTRGSYRWRQLPGLCGPRPSTRRTASRTASGVQYHIPLLKRPIPAKETHRRISSSPELSRGHWHTGGNATELGRICGATRSPPPSAVSLRGTILTRSGGLSRG